MTDRVWATTIGAEDCYVLPDDRDVICDMCGLLITGLHMHVDREGRNVFGSRQPILGFCSEACAGRWVAGETVVAERIVT